MIDPKALTKLLRTHLPAQRWYAGAEEPKAVRIHRLETVMAGWPALVRAIVEADGAVYQLLVGLRPASEEPEFLRGRDDAVIGEIDTDRGWAGAYDAVHDAQLGLALLETLDETAERCRPLGFEQSNTSLVYDERLILKLYRRLYPGRNRDVEMTEALAATGFDNVARPVAVERADLGQRGSFDLSVLQPFLAGGADGWALALTSLRDLFGVFDTQQVPVIDLSIPRDPVEPAVAGGDFAAEARRLGAITGEMHLRLAEAFGTEPADPRAWADDIEAQMAGVEHPDLDPRGALHVTQRLRELDDAGPLIRTHGDFHLAQALRTDEGWFILDFEGEPDRPPEERNRPSSALRDVAGMLRSLHYAAQVALLGRDTDGADLADSWESRNRWAFFDGYTHATAGGGVLPPSAAAISSVLAAFELEKAVYELGYERGHRPDWVHIPVAALQRLGMGR